VELKLNLKGLEELKNSLDGKMLEKIVGRTLGRTTTKYRTVTTKEVRKTYNIKSKDLKNYIKLKRISAFERMFIIKGESIGLEYFRARQTKSGVSISVKRGERYRFKHAFMRKDTNGHIRVFERDGKERMPISRKFSLSVPQMFNDKILKKGLDEAENTFEKEFEHNLDYYLGKLK
jgi:hypothetical protein